MRDSDSALVAPEIICLGDSYMLGWGVEQQQTFSFLLGAVTGKKTLNAAMASYGTAREIKWLTKLDTAALRYIILQYCRNDVDENISFNQRTGQLLISPAETYDRAQAEYHWSRQYFPGKYAVTLTYVFLKEKLRRILKGDTHPYYVSEDPVASAAQFVGVLKHIAINPDKVKLLLIDLNDYRELNDQFIRSADSILTAPQYRKLKKALQVVDVSKALSDTDYYILDAHLKLSGHVKIARLLAACIRN